MIENFRPGVADRLGIGYDDVRRVRDDILYCSISGFGQTGPYRNRPGFDIMAQGMVGFLRMTGEPDGRPAKVGIAINDIAAGATAIYSIMAARDGSAGRPVAASTWTSRWSTRGWPGPSGSRRLLRRRRGPRRHRHPAPPVDAVPGVPHQRRLRDDRRRQRPAVGAPGDDVLERPEWLEDERFSTCWRPDGEHRRARGRDRDDHHDPHRPGVDRAHSTRRVSRAARSHLRRDVQRPARAGPRHGRRGRAPDHRPDAAPSRPPTKFSEHRLRRRGPAPWLGQHTADLRDSGVKDDEIDQLFTDGVLFDAHPELERETRHDRPICWWSATRLRGRHRGAEPAREPQRDHRRHVHRPARPGARPRRRQLGQGDRLPRRRREVVRVRRRHQRVREGARQRRGGPRLQREGRRRRSTRSRG